jgi:hypothetical protein
LRQAQAVHRRRQFLQVAMQRRSEVRQRRRSRADDGRERARIVRCQRSPRGGAERQPFRIDHLTAVPEHPHRFGRELAESDEAARAGEVIH